MKIGEADGAGVIYDENGDIILHEGEKVLLKEDDFVPELLTTWGYFGGEALIEKGPGTGYLTNERFIFIQSVETTATIGGKTDTLSSTTGYVKIKDQKKLGKAQSHDYFEILNKEMLACEVRNTQLANAELINIYILSKGEQCHMSVALPVNSQLLERFKQKTVANSNELVKNIKDYFQNTKWIYSEEEKALLGVTDEPNDPEAVTGQLTQAQKAEIEKKVEDMKKSRVVKGPPAQKKTPEEKIRLLEDRYHKGQISKDIYEKLKAEYLGAMISQQTATLTGDPAPGGATAEQRKPLVRGPPQPTAEPGDIDKKLALLEERFKKGLVSPDLYQSLKNDYLKAKQFQNQNPAVQAPAPQPQVQNPYNQPLPQQQRPQPQMQPQHQQPPQQAYQQPPQQQRPQPQMQPQYQQPPQQAYQQPPQQQRPQPQMQPQYQQPPQQAYQQPPQQQRPQPQMQQPGNLSPSPVLGTNPNPMLSQQNANKKKDAGADPLAGNK